MNSSDINKYKDKTIGELIQIAQRHFNTYIRKRDEGNACINCQNYRILQAGHFYPTSTHSYLRFHEDNVHGECLQCNYYNSQSHAYGYAKHIVTKIGKERFEKLELLARTKSYMKWDRFSLIETIETYKKKLHDK